MKRFIKAAALTFSAALTFTTASAHSVASPGDGRLIPSKAFAVTFDASNGTGFVGKGDVQLAFGWNNAQLQANAASLEFSYESTVITEVSWICTNSKNEHIQERTRTITTSIQGVLESVARMKNQITGFDLTGYDGAPIQSSSTDGPKLDSCPAGFWYLSTAAGDPVELSNTSVLKVNGVALQ